MLEIEAAKIAETKGNAEEKKFAVQMVTDHTKTSSDLKGLVGSVNVKADIPTSLDSSSQKKLDELNNAKPDNFAGVYDPHAGQCSQGCRFAVRALLEIGR
jgi:putative membrane protein